MQAGEYGIPHDSYSGTPWHSEWAACKASALGVRGTEHTSLSGISDPFQVFLITVAILNFTVDHTPSLIGTILSAQTCYKSFLDSCCQYLVSTTGNRC